MTKPFESYRDEIVRLYIDENRTLEVVMDLMRTRHNFEACRRSYMDNLKRWGVRKYRRKVVVHNQRAGDVDDADAAADAADDIHQAQQHQRPAAADDLGPPPSQSQSQPPAHGAQSLVLPYLHQAQPQQGHAHQQQTHAHQQQTLVHHHQQGHAHQQQTLVHQQQPHVTPRDWGYFAGSRWPPEQTAAGSAFASRHVDDHPSHYRAAHASRIHQADQAPSEESAQESEHEQPQTPRWGHRYAMH